MSSPSIPSPGFRSSLDAALDGYTKQTGIDLTEHTFANDLQNCDTSDAILQLFQDREKTFKVHRDKYRKLITCLRPVIEVVHAFSGSLSEVATLVPFPPTNVIFVGIDVLLTAAIGVSASYDALVDLFDRVGNFLKRLRIYEEIPLDPTMAHMLVRILIEVLFVLALATKQIKQGRLTKFTKKLLGESETEAILQRLDRLTQEEARMTAAQTLEVVHGLFNNLKAVIDNGKVSTDGIRRTLVTTQEMADRVNKTERNQFQKDVRSWLSPPDPSTNHNVARRDYHDGTATWFTQNCIFEEWKTSGSLLWIHGKPGSGKSILCSSIIQDVKGMHNTGLAVMAYFYCDFRDPRKQDVNGLVASLLAQLSAKSDACHHALADLYLEYDAGSRQPDDNELRECLVKMLKIEGQPAIYMTVDAVDECPNASESDVKPCRDRVLDLVEMLVVLHLPNVRICLTSRPEVDIREVLEPLASHIVSLHDQSGQKNDIIDYVSFVVHSDRNMRRWRPNDKKLVVETLSQKADGMFRWAVCQLAILRRCLPAAIRHALDDLPEGLDKTYDRILLNICRERREYARRLFQCMAVSIRPLRVDELAGVFAIQFDASALPSYDVTCQPEDSEEALLSTCSSLITVVKVEGSPVVQFSHFSVKEYLTSERLENAEKALSYYHIRPMSAHTTLAQASLSVLLTLNEQVDKNSMKIFPFAIYAAQHWVVHAQFENVSSSIEDAMGRLFNPIEPHFAVWVWIYDIDHQFRGIMSEAHPTQPEAVPLYYATLCGFRNLVERLIVSFPQNVDAGGGYYGTPLHAALAKGYVDIALLLLQHYANVNALNEEGITPLHKACKRGLSDIVVWLLKHHANVDARDKNGDTPLLMASDAGERGIVEVLLDHGAPLDSRNKIGWTPLMSASQNGHPDIVELLLQRGATVDSSDDDGWTALTPAARHGHANVVDRLLNHGAVVNSSDKDGWTPLMSASQNGNLNVVEVLLQNGAVVDPHDSGGWTPLMTASRNGHLQVVRLLLQNGAAVDSRSNEGWTPLMSASEQGHLDIVQELLQSGASMDLRSHDGVASFGNMDPSASEQNYWSPLHLASAHGHLEITCLLLESGANANSYTCRGWTPLHCAARNGHLDIVKLLLESDADIYIRTADDETPLTLASSNGRLEVAKFLAAHGSVDTFMMPSDTTSQNSYIDMRRNEINHANEKFFWPTALEKSNLPTIQYIPHRGTDANQRDADHRTSLHAASIKGDLEVAKLLIKGGADVNCRDRAGWSPLHDSARHERFDIVRLLLDNGADVNVRDQDQRTPLHLASHVGNVKIAKLLLERGADIHAQNCEGRIPSQIASRVGALDVRRLLEEYSAQA